MIRLDFFLPYIRQETADGLTAVAVAEEKGLSEVLNILLSHVVADVAEQALSDMAARSAANALEREGRQGEAEAALSVPEAEGREVMQSKVSALQAESDALRKRLGLA